MKKLRLTIRGGLYAGLLLLLILPRLAFAQNTNNQITGTVRDAKGEQLPGVTVQVKGTAIGTQTNANGSFAITAGGDATLTFSFIGYNTLEYPVQNQKVISVTLTDNSQALDEVVVVAYGTQKRATISGAISTLGAADIVRTPALAATSALVGKIAGVTARTTDARPGRGASINIRNLGNPLYVIDGVAYSTSDATDAFGFNTGQSGVNAFNQLGLEDIESVTVLKDASASIYGLAAGNGVVLVTTKKGKKTDVPKISVNSYYGFQNFTRYPYPANAGLYVLAQNQSTQNLNIQNNRADPLPYPASELAAWANESDQAHRNNDYYKAVMRPNVPQSNINANVSGGSKNTNYYLSVGNVSQDALIKGNNFKRTNLQSNISSTIANGLTVGAQIAGRIENTFNIGVPNLDDFFNPFLSIGSMWPTEKMYANDNPNYINQTHNVNVNPATYKEEIAGYTKDRVDAMNVNLTAEYAFKFGLTVKGLYSYSFRNQFFDNFEYTYKAYIYNPKSGNYDDRPTLADGVTPDPKAGLYGNQNPWHETRRSNVTSTFLQASLNYQHQFGDHGITAVAAFEQRETKNIFLSVNAPPPNNIVPIQYLADIQGFTDTRTIESTQGVAMRLNYDYKKKYLIEGVGRYDGSYIYAPGQRYGFFPGVTLGWRISEEGFFKNHLGNTINNLKLRLSYGATGTSIANNPAAFAYLAGYNVNNGSAVFNGVFYNGVRPRGVPTQFLSWTRNTMANIGLDFDIINHFSGTIDVFQRRRSGLPAAPANVIIPSETGYTLPQANLDSDITQGFDFGLTYNGRAGDNVRFTIGGNATLGRTKMDVVNFERFGNSYDEWRNKRSGRWNGTNFAHHIIGRFTSQAEINAYPVNIDGQGNRTLLPGDFKYEDLNQDGIISSLDQKPIGYAEGALPYFNYGVNGSVSYKAFALAFTFSGASMQSYFRDFELKYPFQNGGNSPTYMLNDVWHKADVFDNNSQWVPGTYPAIRNNNNQLSIYNRNDFWLTNVRYFRLRNLELSYQVPTTLLKKAGITSLRLYVAGSNLLSFDNVKQFQIDPEISSGNGLVYPQQKIYTFGFNLTL
jgi:TonB-linked SusC/RagA family outer membrane protein